MIIITLFIFRGAPTKKMIIGLGYESHACQHAAFLVHSGHYKHASEERKIKEKVKMKIVQDYSECSLLIKTSILLKTSSTLLLITRLNPFTDTLLTTPSRECLLSLISWAADSVICSGLYQRGLGGTPLGLCVGLQSAAITSMVTLTSAPLSRLPQWRHLTNCGKDITLQLCCLCQSNIFTFSLDVRALGVRDITKTVLLTTHLARPGCSGAPRTRTNTLAVTVRGLDNNNSSAVADSDTNLTGTHVLIILINSIPYLITNGGQQMTDQCNDQYGLFI